MISLAKAFVLSTCLLSTFASPTHHHDDEATNWDKFSALLDTVDEMSLHRVLHALSPKFKDGVFSKDRTAIEHVHSENPIMASKLVHIAKRQSSNSTVVVTPSPSPTTSSSSSSSSSSSEQSNPTSESVSSAVSSAISSALSSELTASTVPPPTTVLVAPTTPSSATPISTEPGKVVYSTYGGGVVTLTSSAVSVHFSPSTSTHLITSTLPNGQLSTSTALVVVNAPITSTAPATGAAAGATTAGSAGLQNGAEKTVAGRLVAAIAGIVGFIAYL